MRNDIVHEPQRVQGVQPEISRYRLATNYLRRRRRRTIFICLTVACNVRERERLVVVKESGESLVRVIDQELSNTLVLVSHVFDSFCEKRVIQTDRPFHLRSRICSLFDEERSTIDRGNIEE